MRGLRLLALLFVVVLVAAACGDSADTTATTVAPETTTTLTPPRAATLAYVEYTDRADTICANTVEQFDAALVPAIGGYIGSLGDEPYTNKQLMGFYAEMSRVTDELFPLLTGMLSELQTLPSPDTDEAIIEDLWVQIEARFATARGVIITASTDPIAARALWDEEDPPLLDLNQRATELGMPSCMFD